MWDLYEQRELRGAGSYPHTYSCAHTDHTGGDQYRYGGAGGAASHGWRLRRRRRKWHATFLAGRRRGQAPRVDVSTGPQPRAQDRTSGNGRTRPDGTYGGERERGQSPHSERPVDGPPRVAPGRRLTAHHHGEVCPRGVASPYLIRIHARPPRRGERRSVYCFPVLAIARNCAATTSRGFLEPRERERGVSFKREPSPQLLETKLSRTCFFHSPIRACFSKLPLRSEHWGDNGMRIDIYDLQFNLILPRCYIGYCDRLIGDYSLRNDSVMYQNWNTPQNACGVFTVHCPVQFSTMKYFKIPSQLLAILLDRSDLGKLCNLVIRNKK